jgi:hypothetical protein
MSTLFLYHENEDYSVFTSDHIWIGDSRQEAMDYFYRTIYGYDEKTGEEYLNSYYDDSARFFVGEDEDGKWVSY